MQDHNTPHDISSDDQAFQDVVAHDLAAESGEELDALLAAAEADIRRFREELAARRQAQIDDQIDQLPQDLSSVAGKWSDLRNLLRTLTSGSHH